MRFFVVTLIVKWLFMVWMKAPWEVLDYNNSYNTSSSLMANQCQPKLNKTDIMFITLLANIIPPIP